MVSLIYLAAAVLIVPLAQALGLGSIIGYLVAGLAIGPYGLGLVKDPESILHFAEFGVVLMLFLIGLELEPRRLWSMRRPIFGWGSAQMLGCAAAVFAAVEAEKAWRRRSERPGAPEARRAAHAGGRGAFERRRDRGARRRRRP